MKKLAATAALAALLPAVVLGAPVAIAHDSVVGGNVTTGEVLDEFPSEITLEFSAIPRDQFNTFAVTDTDSGEVLFDATPVIDGRNLTVEVPADVHPGSGNYQVGFQITSSDGHATRGSVPFSVSGGASSAAGAADAPSASASAAPANEDSAQAASPEATAQGLPMWAKWGIALAAVLAAAAVIIMLLGKRNK